MPKTLFFNVPAHGHVNPSLPLVAELVRRGHEVTYFTTESYRQRVAETRASVEIYEGVEDDYFGVRGLDGSVPQMAARVLLITAGEILPGLLERVTQAQPDYLMYDCMCPWGYFLAQITGLPSVASASLMPLVPRLMRDWKVLRLFLPMLVRGFQAGSEANRLSRALGEQYHVTPLGMMNVLNAPADLVISYSSASYVPYADLLEDNVRLVGWTLQANGSDETFVHESPRPLVYVSLGTVANDNRAFFETCIAALVDLPYDVLITTGGRYEAAQFGTLPANITLRPWVPQAQVIQQAALFVTHGGLNSLHDGLYCGLPLLIVPQQTEQTFNAMRVVDLGAGLMLKPGQVTASALRESVTTLLSDERYRQAAQRLGDTFRAAGGVVRAADEIEAWLRAQAMTKASQAQEGSFRKRESTGF